MLLTVTIAKPLMENAAAAAQLTAARKIVTAATPTIVIMNVMIAQDAMNPILIVKAAPDPIAYVIALQKKTKKRFIPAADATELQ